MIRELAQETKKWLPEINQETLKTLTEYWCTKSFLYNAREPRYEQIKMGYQISKYLNIGQSSCLEI